MGLLRNMLLFVVYDPVTRLPKYTKYNFNFEMYAAEKGLINASKFDIFSAFIVESKILITVKSLLLMDLKNILFLML